MDDALALLRAHVAAGTTTLVATPHVSQRYPTTPDEIDAGVAALRTAGIDLEILAGAEVTHEKALELPDEELRRLTLGDSRTVLLESPLKPTVGPIFERCVTDLHQRGYRVLLAHPERAPAFLDRPMRLRALVEQGALCSLTAGAFSGRFGQGPRWFALELMRDGLAHSVDSDAHNTLGRPPGLREGMLDAAETLPFVAKRAGWYMKRVPAALLADEPLPQP
jgi:protein-tyrosine phosphatase